jgi:hypothetical protein
MLNFAFTAFSEVRIASVLWARHATDSVLRGVLLVRSGVMVPEAYGCWTGQRGGEARKPPPPMDSCSVLAPTHDTEGQKSTAKDHRQRPEDPRRREAAGVR